jgi:hypothetical protein
MFRLSYTGCAVLDESVSSTGGAMFFMFSVPVCETVLRISAKDAVVAAPARARLDFARSRIREGDFEHRVFDTSGIR